MSTSGVIEVASSSSTPTSSTPASPELSSTDLSEELMRFLRTMERTGAQVAARRRGDVDKAAFSVLFRLLHDGPQRSGTLAEAMLADPSTVSRHVAHLVGAGLVERTADPDDGRATVIAVTEQGRRVAHQLRERRHATIAAVVADWDPADVSRIATLLGRFTDDLELHRPRILAACSDDPAPTSTALTTQGES